MKNINELRIGNWVHHKADYWSYRQDSPYKKEFKEFDFQWELTDFHALGECTLNEEDFEPILLTEEWLTKFGFIRNEPCFENIKNPYFVHQGVCLFFTETPPENTYLIGYGFTWEGKYYASTSVWIKYVHQLQNLYFALKGEELI